MGEQVNVNKYPPPPNFGAGNLTSFRHSFKRDRMYLEQLSGGIEVKRVHDVAY